MLNQIKNRGIRIRLNDGTRVNGQVNISGYDCLSDLIKDRSNDFLVITRATLYQTDLENPVKHEIMFMGKQHIAWAVPDSEQE